MRGYHDNKIDMRKASLKVLVEGTMKFKLRYGHPGREKYFITRNLKVHAKLDAKAGGYLIVEHSDVQ